MVTLVPSVLPLQASKASWGGLLRSPRGGLLKSVLAHTNVGNKVPSRQIMTHLLLWCISMAISFSKTTSGSIVTVTQVMNKKASTTLVNSTLFKKISGLKGRQKM
jgi:hypothetical protein